MPFVRAASKKSWLNSRFVQPLPQKNHPARIAKEVGVGNPAEETTRAEQSHSYAHTLRRATKFFGNSRLPQTRRWASRRPGPAPKGCNPLIGTPRLAPSRLTPLILRHNLRSPTPLTP